MRYLPINTASRFSSISQMISKPISWIVQNTQQPSQPITWLILTELKKITTNKNIKT